jgi:hypothetical protein
MSEVVQFKPKNDQPAVDSGESLADVVARLNAIHSVVTMGGTTVIMNETESQIYPGRIDRNFSKKSDIELRYLNEPHTVGVSAQGKPIVKTSAVIWLGDANRRQYNELFFDPRRRPGGDDLTHTYNLFRGWPVAFNEPEFSRPPIMKKWRLTREHVLQVICNGNKEHARWVWSWVAERLKHPEKTAQVALVLMGGEGAGKGTFAKDIFGGLYHPQHFVHVIDTKHLFGQWNYHIVDALAVFCDEAFFAADPSAIGRMKGMLTESHILLEAKYKDPIPLPNMRAFILASNDTLVVPAGIDARRFAVFEVNEGHKGDHEYFAAIRAELADGGREEMVRYLIQEDFGDVNPYQAPMTDALVRQKELNFTPVIRYWFDKLSVGTLPRVGAPDEVWSEDGEMSLSMAAALRDYLTCPYMTRAHERHIRSAETELGIQLKRLIPSSRKKQRRYDGKRIRIWELPSLKQARAEFDKALGSPYPWDGDK